MMLGVDKDELPVQVNLRWESRPYARVYHNLAKAIVQRRCTTSALLRMVLRLGRTRTSLKSSLMSESTLGMAARLHTHRTSRDIAIGWGRNPASTCCLGEYAKKQAMDLSTMADDLRRINKDLSRL